MWKILFIIALFFITTGFWDKKESAPNPAPAAISAPASTAADSSAQVTAADLPPYDPNHSLLEVLAREDEQTREKHIAALVKLTEQAKAEQGQQQQ